MRACVRVRACVRACVHAWMSMSNPGFTQLYEYLVADRQWCNIIKSNFHALIVRVAVDGV